jgi:hypothetical protein
MREPPGADLGDAVGVQRREAKVDDPRDAIRDRDVLWLEIAMDDSELVNRGQPVAT